MPILVPHHLTFRGGLHLGTRGVNLEEAGLSVSSDTLFGAVLDTCRRQGIDVSAFAAPFVSDPPDPPFLLSSAFPRVGEVRFYPLPTALERLLVPETLRLRGKAARRMGYLSEGLLRKALAGNRLDEDLFPADSSEEPRRGAALQNGALWFSLEEMEKMPRAFQRAAGKRHALHALNVWQSGRVPRVTVSRITQTSAVFNAGRVVFSEGCGLWFGVAWRRAEACLPDGIGYRAALDSSFHSLQYDGLGGERSSGYGAFDLAIGDAVDLGNDPQPGRLCWLISRYHPRPAELPAALDPTQGCAYTLAGVAGWMRSPDGAAQRRKKVTLVNEGSLVIPPVLPAGDVVDVRPTYRGPAGAPEHPVYRYGLALGLGL